jgi:hypothetical protein
MNWERFKETKFAVKCTSGKDKFFSDCAEHGIYNFINVSSIKENAEFIAEKIINAFK